MIAVEIPEDYNVTGTYPAEASYQVTSWRDANVATVTLEGGGLVILEAKNGNQSWYHAAIVPEPVPIPEAVNLNPVIWEVQDQAEVVRENFTAAIQSLPGPYDDSLLAERVDKARQASEEAARQASTANAPNGVQYANTALLVIIGGFVLVEAFKGRGNPGKPREERTEDAVGVDLLDSDPEE